MAKENSIRDYLNSERARWGIDPIPETANVEDYGIEFSDLPYSPNDADEWTRTRYFKTFSRYAEELREAGKPGGYKDSKLDDYMRLGFEWGNIDDSEKWDIYLHVRDICERAEAEGILELQN